jgi:hypothetical protein
MWLVVTCARRSVNGKSLIASVDRGILHEISCGRIVKSPSPRFLALLIGATLSCTAAEAATLFDPFTDGALVGGADASGLSWYRRSANQAIGIVNDSAGLGSGNALQLTIPGGVQINRPILGVFSDFTLVNEGDQISLTLDFRFAATPGNVADGWRFGFYNANGTVMTSNGGSESDNDFGYLATIGTGTSSSFNLYEELNTSGAGETGFGTDRISLSPTVNATAAISNTAEHTLVFTVTKTASGVSIATTVDGISLGSGVDTTAPYLTFNEVLISHGTPQAYLIDNVTVTTTAVPEPGAAALLGVGVLSLFGWRRSRRS